MKIVMPKEMNAMDRRTVEEGRFTSLQLMQNAAEALYKEVSSLMEERGLDRVLILAGPGNNGGDAYALACLLHPGYHPAVLSVGGLGSSDGIHYFQKCKDLGIPFVTEAGDYPLVVDGIFGTGFHGELPEEIRTLLKTIKAPVVAIDLPSGMDGMSGVASPGTLKPIRTVTFGYRKPCHLLADCGEVVVADIGIPESYAEEITRSELTPVLPERSDWGHKTSYGSVGLWVGADQYPGAASLAVLGALKSGAGLVYAYLPDSIRRSVSSKFYGPVFLPRKKWTESRVSCILFGSGVGRDRRQTRQLATLWNFHLPLVIDGDGLYHYKLLCSRLRRGRKSFRGVPLYQTPPAPRILTPHIGEFARLMETSVEEVRRNRIFFAEEYAKKYHVILVLKDAATLVTDGTRTEILSRPCSALAKGGSGDLLAGLLAGLLSSGMSPFEAAGTAVYLHNRAGHLASLQESARSLQPEEIALYINDAWMELEHGTL